MSYLLRRLLIGGGYMQENQGEDGSGASSGGGGDVASDADAGESSEGEQKKPSDEVAKLVKDVMSKKAANEKLKKELEAREAVIKQIEELGGLDALKAVVGQKKAEEAKKLEEKGEWDRLKSQMNEEHGKQLSQVQSQISELGKENEQLKSRISELTVGNSFMSSAFIKEDLVIPPSKARLLYGSHFDFQDGKPVAYDKPAGSAERTMLVDAKGEALDFESAIKRIVDADPDRDQLLRSKAKSGAGSSTAGKVKTPPEQIDAPRGSSRIAAALVKGVLTK